MSQVSQGFIDQIAAALLLAMQRTQRKIKSLHVFTKIAGLKSCRGNANNSKCRGLS